VAKAMNRWFKAEGFWRVCMVVNSNERLAKKNAL